MVYLGNSRRRFQALILVALASGIVLSVMPQQFWDRMNTINVENEDQRDASSASRIHFWRVATTMAAEKPLTGVGFNAYSRAFDSYDTLNGFYGSGRAVHSTWFGILAETGFPGLVLLVCIVGRAFLGCRRAYKSLKGQKGEDAELMMETAKAVQNSLIAYVIGGSFINAHYSELFWHFAWLSIAIECIAQDVAARKPVEEAKKPSVVPPLRPVPRARPYAVAR
jgi:O-antigen ligase